MGTQTEATMGQALHYFPRILSSDPSDNSAGKYNSPILQIRKLRPMEWRITLVNFTHLATGRTSHLGWVSQEPTRLGLTLSEAKLECQLSSDLSTKRTYFSMRCRADLSLLRKWYMMRKNKAESVFSCSGKYPRMKNLFLIFKTNTVLKYHEKKKKKALVAQSCPTLCDPTDCRLPGSSVHGILQARILEWVAIPFSRGSFPRIEPESPALQAVSLQSKLPRKTYQSEKDPYPPISN